MSNRFEGEVAIATGASRGIGLNIAEHLVAEGAKATITARKQGALDEAVRTLGGPDHARGWPAGATTSSTKPTRSSRPSRPSVASICW
ncbi:SDR family NAD(P)-dependent oxidoreductase [Micromonospora sp. NPDC050686]|uniref:SDR family NAD(P)-dependent oxidoreductase n=1 Tax=Micromonospora sp. NPDC050686 TaxID=3154631 RepID=UPI003401D0D4